MNLLCPVHDPYMVKMGIAFCNADKPEDISDGKVYGLASVT